MPSSRKVVARAYPTTGRELQTRYVMRRESGRCSVIVERPDGPDLIPEPLGDRPNEFEWGYVGEGPKALALALLGDRFGGALPEWVDVGKFADEFIARFPPEGLTLTQAMLDYVLTHRFDAPVPGDVA